MTSERFYFIMTSLWRMTSARRMLSICVAESRLMMPYVSELMKC